MRPDSDLDRALMKIITRALHPLEHNMADVLSSLGKLRAAIAAIPDRIAAKVANLKQSNADLVSALADERALADTLAASEAAEDVQQNAELTAARAETDRLSALVDETAGEIDTAAEELNSIAAPDAQEEVPDETPVTETPAEETPDEETPAEETPVEQVPEETPVTETPAEETPVEQVPEETPVEGEPSSS